MEIEKVILEGLIYNETFSRKVIPFLKSEYFSTSSDRIVYDEILTYTQKYNKLPTNTELIIGVKNRKGISQNDFQDAVNLLSSMTKKTAEPSIEWLIEHTEQFCKDKALYNVLVDAVEVVSGENASASLGSIPEQLTNALAITFDATVGLAFDETENRWDRRQKKNVEKVRFSTDAFNEATNGGMHLKSLSCVAAGTGAGKSAWMCDQAAYSLRNGVDVLYITMELDEDSITDRIDANILDMDIGDVLKLSRSEYSGKLKSAINSKFGRLFVKEYPTACAGVLEFRSLLNELKLKKNFQPKLVIIDYLNICNSSRVKMAAVNSYTLIKSIAEELRALAKEYNIAILTGTQLNREGNDNVNVSLKEISESSGLSHTVDFLFALMRTELLDQKNQVLVKQLKNRFADMVKKLKFTIGVARSRFKYFDVAQENEDSEAEETVDSDTGEILNKKAFGIGRRKNRDFSGLVE